MSSTKLHESLRAKAISSASRAAQSHKSRTSLNTKSAKPTGTRNAKSVSKTSIDQLKPAKRTRDRIPPPQREQILLEYATGKSITDISKNVNRNRETVAKIVHGPEIQALVSALRERLYNLGSHAIDAVDHAITVQKDGRLAFQVLSSLGVIPSPAERQPLIAPRPETETDEATRVKKIYADLTEMAVEAGLVYGVPLPQLEADLKKVGGRLNYERGKLEPIEEGTTT